MTKRSEYYIYIQFENHLKSNFPTGYKRKRDDIIKESEGLVLKLKYRRDIKWEKFWEATKMF